MAAIERGRGHAERELGRADSPGIGPPSQTDQMPRERKLDSVVPTRFSRSVSIGKSMTSRWKARVSAIRLQRMIV